MTPLIKDRECLAEERRLWREKGLRVVLTNGCFDLLHVGHLKLLQEARRHGDILIVAINSDLSVRKLKGPKRPVTPEAERAEILLALEPVDRVVVYDEPTPYEVIQALLPDVLVKGSDWEHDKIVGRELVEAAGGIVIRVNLVPDQSTTALVARIQSL